MESHEFLGKVKMPNKAFELVSPLLYIVLALYFFYVLFRRAPDLVNIENILESIVVALPFYISIISLRSIKNILFAKIPSDFDIKYQLFDEYLELETTDILNRIRYTDISDVTNPEKTGRVIKVRMNSGRDMEMPIPEEKYEFYVQLKKKLTGSSS